MTVKDLFVEAKDISELMVDLAYAAVFFGDEDIGREVTNLREEMTWVVRTMRTMSTLAARSREDAQALSGVLRMVAAMDKMADAAEDIARVVLKDLGVPREVRDDLRHAAEVTARVRLRDDNGLEGRSLKDAALPTSTGMWLIAIRRDVSWIFGPKGSEVLQAGDVVFAQGPEEGVNLLRELAGAPALHLAETPARRLTDLDRAVDLLVEMKNATEVCVGLAYSAVLFGDRGLAAEVAALEDATDEMHHELERWTLRAVQEVPDPDDLRGLLHLAFASERIADAAQEMTRVIEDEEAPHPIIIEALAEADEIVMQAEVGTDGGADGRTLRDLSLRTELGMEVLAVQRAGRWMYGPRGRFTLAAGDRVIAVGPEDGQAAMAELFGFEHDEEE
jgi:uncharacterized protein with PhoU and TrkA domain